MQDTIIPENIAAIKMQDWEDDRQEFDKRPTRHSFYRTSAVQQRRRAILIGLFTRYLNCFMSVKHLREIATGSPLRGR